jgi:hypothetical protein
MRSASGNESKAFEDVLSDGGGAEFWAWDPWEAAEAEAVEGSVVSLRTGTGTGEGRSTLHGKSEVL